MRKIAGLDPDNYLCIPYHSVLTGLDRVAHYDPALTDAATITAAVKQQFWGLDATGLRNIHRGKRIGIDLKFGIRSLNLENEFAFRQRMTTQFPQPFAEFGSGFPGTFSITDSFKARNQFIGADLGAKISFEYGRFCAELQPRVAIGGNMQAVEIRGESTALDSSMNTFYVRGGGFWALDTNIGDHRRTRFAVVPELALKVGVHITGNLDFLAGYSFTYWNDVVVAGDHVSRSLNQDKIPLGGYGASAATPAAPAFRFQSTDFWAHGVTAGFRIKF